MPYSLNTTQYSVKGRIRRLFTMFLHCDFMSHAVVNTPLCDPGWTRSYTFPGGIIRDEIVTFFFIFNCCLRMTSSHILMKKLVVCISYQVIQVLLIFILSVCWAPFPMQESIFAWSQHLKGQLHYFWYVKYHISWTHVNLWHLIENWNL